MAQVKGFTLAACKDRPVKEELRESWARPVTTGVAQFSLLEEPTGRTLALLLQGICSHFRVIARTKAGGRPASLRATRTAFRRAATRAYFYAGDCALE